MGSVARYLQTEDFNTRRSPVPKLKYKDMQVTECTTDHVAFTTHLVLTYFPYHWGQLNFIKRDSSITLTDPFVSFTDKLSHKQRLKNSRDISFTIMVNEIES